MCIGVYVTKDESRTRKEAGELAMKNRFTLTERSQNQATGQLYGALAKRNVASPTLVTELHQDTSDT